MDDFAIKNIDSCSNSSIECEVQDIKRTAKHIAQKHQSSDPNISSHSSIEQCQNKNSTEETSSCGSIGHDRDPEQVIVNQIVDYYNKNYELYQIFQMDNHVNREIWNVHYDEHTDIVYVMLAKMKYIKGKQLVLFS